jgi:hypothetical protein
MATLLDEIRGKLYLPDPTPFYCVLATMVANRALKGPAMQFMLIGPPSCGGTELLMLLTKSVGVHHVSRMTTESLLSGTSKKEVGKGSKGGLLREVSEGDVLLFKDFTSILSLRHESKAELLGALREVADGQYDRSVGTDGGRTLHWHGKVGILTKCTFEIDKQWSVITSMGDRFIYYRYPYTEHDYYAAITAIEQFGWEKDVVREMVAEFLNAICADAAELEPQLTKGEVYRLASFGAMCARARASVDRDRYKGNEIVSRDDPEHSPRLSLYFTMLFKALMMIGLVRAEAWRVMGEVAISTMPGARATALRSVMHATRLNGTGGVTVGEVLEQVGGGRETAIRYALEELEVHGVLVRKKGAARLAVVGGIGVVNGSNNGVGVNVNGTGRSKSFDEVKAQGRASDVWMLSDWAVTKWRLGWQGLKT